MAPNSSTQTDSEQLVWQLEPSPIDKIIKFCITFLDTFPEIPESTEILRDLSEKICSFYGCSPEPVFNWLQTQQVPPKQLPHFFENVKEELDTADKIIKFFKEDFLKQYHYLSEDMAKQIMSNVAQELCALHNLHDEWYIQHWISLIEKVSDP